MTHTFSIQLGTQALAHSPATAISRSCLLWLAYFAIGHSAYAASPITPAGLNTQVSAPLSVTDGNTQFDITGGTRAGANLFHSFGEFNVPTNNIANFLNDSGLETSNILGRVTGGNPSSIFGTIQTSGFENANLFLMNPAGIVFGPNATLNVGGSVAFTAADYLRLEDNGRFNAVPSSSADALLSTHPVTAYGFLGANPGVISVEGSQFTMSEGKGISLVGRNITIQSGTLNNGTVQPTHISAPGGQINLASVASSGEISTVNFMPMSDVVMGNVTLSQGTTLNVSANAAGAVRIRGGQLTIDNATISADTINATGSPSAIDIHITNNMALANDLSPALTARTTGTGNAGTINIQSGSLEATTSSSADGLIALVDTHTSGTGTAGSVVITAGKLLASNEAFFIDAGTAGTGHGGNITIHGADIQIAGPNIATGNYRFAQLLEQDVRGSAGNLTIKATETLVVGPAATLSTEAWFAQGGNITLEGHNVGIIGNSFVSVDGDFGSPIITVTADQLLLNRASLLNNNTVVDPGGAITILAREVQLTEGSQIKTSTLGNGKAGNITITASESLTLNGRGGGQSGFPFPSAIVSNFYGDPEFSPTGAGDSGSITVNSPKLQILEGALINTSTNTNGNAGNIYINSNSVAISGQSQFEVLNASTEIGSTRGSGIYARTVGSAPCGLAPCGNAGHITIMADLLKLDNGGTINSGTTNNGAGGNITVSAGQSVTIRDGASISANSTGSGNAGVIKIDAGRELSVQNSRITTEAKGAGGGNIEVIAIDRIHLANGRISTSVLAGAGDSGRISIDPNEVIVQNNSAILTQAVQGRGGDITIVTSRFLQDSTSLVDASSQFGQSGRVTIQSSTSNLSGTVAQLSSKTDQTQPLLQNRCVALAGGGHSTFIVAGRDTLPSEPGGWLSSPLVMENGANHEHEDMTKLIVRNMRQTKPSNNMTQIVELGVLSLRRLTPPGFLVRTFAGNGSTGCHS